MKNWRLELHGEDYTDDCDQAEISMPRLVYEVPHDGRWQRRVAGPGGFAITLINPSERLLALVDDGKQVHPLRYVVHGQAVPVPVQFHMQWVERSGVRKMFGCLASNQENEAKWVDDPGSPETDRRV